MIEDIKQRLQNATLGKDKPVTEAQWGEFIAHSRTDMEYLLSQNKALVEALEWYAREDSYDVEEGEYYSLISIDRGDRAREALTTYKGKE